MEKQITFTKANGMKIAAMAYIPEKAGKYPTVIFSHGFNGNYSYFLHHGPHYANNDIAIIFIDFCGGGEGSHSDGCFEDMTILTEIDDLNFVLDKVPELDFVDPERIYLQGESMGGFVSAYVAGTVPEKVKALILWYPALVMPDDSKKRLEANDNTCFGLKINPDFNRIAADIDIYDIMKNYKGNVKLVHGAKDPVVPVSYSERALDTYDHAELIIFKDAQHGFDGSDSEDARDESIEFILNNL